MPAAVRLDVGAVRQGDLHLDEHVARAGLWTRYLLDTQIVRAVKQQRSHGSKTTLSAAPLR